MINPDLVGVGTDKPADTMPTISSPSCLASYRYLEDEPKVNDRVVFIADNTSYHGGPRFFAGDTGVVVDVDTSSTKEYALKYLVRVDDSPYYSYSVWASKLDLRIIHSVVMLPPVDTNVTDNVDDIKTELEKVRAELRELLRTVDALAARVAKSSAAPKEVRQKSMPWYPQSHNNYGPWIEFDLEAGDPLPHPNLIVEFLWKSERESRSYRPTEILASKIKAYSLICAYRIKKFQPHVESPDLY